jgi:hypothetical protein
VDGMNVVGHEFERKIPLFGSDARVKQAG